MSVRIGDHIRIIVLVMGANCDIFVQSSKITTSMPQLIRLYILQVAIGFCLSALFVALLLWLNVANLWHLITHSPEGSTAALMLWIFNGIVFAGAQFGISIMLMPRSDGDAGRGKRIEFDTPRAPADAARSAVSVRRGASF